MNMYRRGEQNIVKPERIDDLLVNPGIGFMTFQRFNGDSLNVEKTWTEGFDIEYSSFNGDLTNKDHPPTSLAYFRVYWRFLEPARGEYHWHLLDRALETARERGQTLLLRIAPYGTTQEEDVPDWYRAMVGENTDFLDRKWLVDPEDPRYAEHFGGFICKMGERYDGHPDLESVDLSIVGAWGEGAGSDQLSERTRRALVDAYLEGFPSTHLIMLLTDAKTNSYGHSKRAVGWRVDCLGDLSWSRGSTWKPEGCCGCEDKTEGWSHMLDYYPLQIIRTGMADAWKKAPVSLEVCWVMQHWKDVGWDADYIIEQSLKWHISSFNAKSSPVPAEWESKVNAWINRMGYRLSLRRIGYPATVRRNQRFAVESWWENTGVAPCYRKYPLVIRLTNAQYEARFQTEADIRDWLPGDSLHDASFFIPAEMPAGTYEVQAALVDARTGTPAIKLANTGRQSDGWYTLGPVDVSKA